MPDLLPINATPQERAISLAVDRLPDAPIKTLWSPQTCPEAQLPWLAWALSVDEWDATWPADTKRQVIAASIDQHRKKGTVGALRRALQRLGYEVEIDERTGVAYTFRLRVRVGEGESAGGAVASAQLNRAVQIALRQKNARSELLDTTYFAKTDAAMLYSGGVTVSGLEVEIGGTPSPLPLDAYSDGMFASYWTTRMRLDYHGPIAKVKRASDNAEFDYKTLTELKAFVEGTTFEFVRFYSQSGFSGALTQIDRCPGAFDSNGIPYIGEDGYYELHEDFGYIDSITILAGLRVALTPSTSSGAAFNVMHTDLTASNAVALNVNSSPIAEGFIVAPSSFQIASISLPTVPCAVSVRSGAGELVISDDTSEDDETLSNSRIRANRLQMGNLAASSGTRIYGCSFWSRRLTDEENLGAIESINSKINP